MFVKHLPPPTLAPSHPLTLVVLTSGSTNYLGERQNRRWWFERGELIKELQLMMRDLAELSWTAGLSGLDHSALLITSGDYEDHLLT